MRWLPFVVLVGCGDVGGSDIDADGREDVDDDCIASFKDEAVDIDDDKKKADVDLCPHDTNAVAGDLDVDGIPDSCDPFPGDTRLDTRRCVTSFQVRWMNASYLAAREGETLWDLEPPISTRGDATVSMISTLPPPYRSMTYDLVAALHFQAATQASSFKLWVRAGDAPSNRDVACGLDGAGNLFVWAEGVRNAIVPVTAPIDGTFRLRATVQGEGANGRVLCRVVAGANSISTTYSPTLAAGSWGFAAEGTEVEILSLVIDSNDSAPPF